MELHKAKITNLSGFRHTQKAEAALKDSRWVRAPCCRGRGSSLPLRNPGGRVGPARRRAALSAGVQGPPDLKAFKTPDVLMPSFIAF